MPLGACARFPFRNCTTRARERRRTSPAAEGDSLMSSIRSWRLPLISAAAGPAFVVGHQVDATVTPAHSAGSWVGSWSAASAPPGTGGLSAKGFRDQTLREIVHTSVGGSAVRVRFSNVFGTAALTIDEVTVGLRDAGAAVLGTNHPV